MKRSGFTLIELSIVLIIIGLVIGSILVGRDLIKAAEARKNVSLIQTLNTAVNTFHIKYNGLPGDLINATSFFTGSINGNGDGHIDDDGDGHLGTNLIEGVNVWNHLASAGLIGGNYKGYADDTAYAVDVLDPFGNLIMNGNLSPEGTFLKPISLDYETYWNSNNVETGGGHYFYFYDYVSDVSGAIFLTQMAEDCWNSCGSLNEPGFITPTDAQAIDQKIDDGLPRTGTVLQVADGLCTTPADRVHYDLTTTDSHCPMIVKAQGF